PLGEGVGSGREAALPGLNPTPSPPQRASTSIRPLRLSGRSRLRSALTVWTSPTERWSPPFPLPAAGFAAAGAAGFGATGFGAAGPLAAFFALPPPGLRIVLL